MWKVAWAMICKVYMFDQSMSCRLLLDILPAVPALVTGKAKRAALDNGSHAVQRAAPH